MKPVANFVSILEELGHELVARRRGREHPSPALLRCVSTLAGRQTGSPSLLLKRLLLVGGGTSLRPSIPS
jgi:hypothetical protein